MVKGKRITKKVICTGDFLPSDKYPAYGASYHFKDAEGNEYVWDTLTIPKTDFRKGKSYTLRMTVFPQRKRLLGIKWYPIQRVREED